MGSLGFAQRTARAAAEIQRNRPCNQQRTAYQPRHVANGESRPPRSYPFSACSWWALSSTATLCVFFVFLRTYPFSARQYIIHPKVRIWHFSEEIELYFISIVNWAGSLVCTTLAWPEKPQCLWDAAVLRWLCVSSRRCFLVRVGRE